MGERTVHEYHKECIEIGETGNFQQNEILANRNLFREKAKLTQEKRCLTSLRSGYYLRMGKNQVKKFAKLPFIETDTITVKDRITDEVVAQFLHEIYSSIRTLPEILGKFTHIDTRKPVPFLPAEVVVKDFLACSTLPALFGYCWTYELKMAYINFITEIARQSQQEVLRGGKAFAFRDHWVFDCFKNYAYSSNIHKFLMSSMGDTLLNVIRSNVTDANKLLEMAREIVKLMDKNLSKLPMDVRYLLWSFATLQEGNLSVIDMVEMLFMDCILIPAITMPKVYCVLPPTFQLDQNAYMLLLNLGSFFRLVRRPAQAKQKYPDLKEEKLEGIGLDRFFEKLVNFDVRTVIGSGLSLSRVMALLGEPRAFMLFTTTDLVLLAQILETEPAFPSARALASGQQVTFEFFRYDLWGIEKLDCPFFEYQMPKEKPENPDEPRSIGIPDEDEKPIVKRLFEKLDIRVNEVERAQFSSLAGVASALFKFLSSTEYSEIAPNHLDDFLNFHESQAHVRLDLKAYTHLNHVILKLQELVPSEYPDIMKYLDDEIRRQKEYLERNYDLLNQIQLASLDLDREMAAIRQQTEESNTVMYSSILMLWLGSDPSIAQKATSMAEQMILSKEAFAEFFTSSCAQIKEFVSPFAGYAFRGVTHHFHTWLCQIMTLDSYRELHRQYSYTDDILMGVSADVINSVCVTPAPPKVQAIIENRNLFEFCKLELMNASFLKVPLEAIKKITSAVHIIQKIFELACGASPQADEMTPLFNYALLASGMTEMYTLQSYLQHFLADISLPDMKLLDEEVSVALTHFVNHVSSLGDIVSSMKL